MESISLWAERMEALDYTPVHRRKCVAAVLEAFTSTGALSPREFNANGVQAWLDGQPSPKTAANKRSYLGSYLDFCMAHGLVDRNVARGVRTRRPRPGKGADVIRPAQLQRVLKHLGELSRGDNRSTSEYRSLVYRFLWATMLRVSELHALTWEEIDMEAGVVRLAQDKCRRADCIPLSEEALRVLRKLPRCSALVFPVRISHHTVHRDFAAVGVDGRGAFHRLRKGGITACVEAGVPVAVLAKLSRHANVSVLVQSYYVAADPTLRDAQAALKLSVA